MTDAYTKAIVSAVGSMSKDRPKLLLKRVLMELEDAGISDAYSEAELVNAIASTDVNSPARTDFYIQLSKWDESANPEWTADTPPRSQERRRIVLTALGFSDDAQQKINVTAVSTAPDPSSSRTSPSTGTPGIKPTPSVRSIGTDTSVFSSPTDGVPKPSSS